LQSLNASRICRVSSFLLPRARTVQVLPLLDGPVGGDPQGPQEFAAESVKLAARSAETIVNRILVVISQLSGCKSADGR
jgi:hypothetical protein